MRFVGLKKLDSILHSSLVLIFISFYLPSGLNFVLQWVIWSHYPSNMQVHLGLGGWYHRCTHMHMGLHWMVNSYFFHLLPPSPIFLCGRFSMGCHDIHLLRWRISCPYYWHQGGLIYWAAKWFTYRIIPLVLYTLSWSVQGHALSMFYHWLADSLDVPNNVYCACQSRPSWVW